MKATAVFIVTHRQGFEADPIIDMLRNDGVSVLRFNCDDGEDPSLISFVFDSDSAKVSFMCDKRRIRDVEIGVGWCQQLHPYIGQSSSAFESLQRENLLTAQLMGFNFLDTPWFNAPKYILSSSNKLLQLRLAPLVGLNTPKTLVSNTPEDIRVFAKKQKIVMKNLATPWIISSHGTDAAYTKIVQEEWLASDREIVFCPIIYQAYHVRRKDYRVVVVGDKIFAACSEPTEEQCEDIRRGEATGKSFRACTFDTRMIDGLKLLMKNLSIEYCAADFMEDEKGDIYFLEVNSCGAWWWVDQLYNGAICREIADKLESYL